jgi:hypothetical protein
MSETSIFDAEFGTRMAVFVDTEEEFDWDESFTRDAHSVSSVPALRDGQRMFSAAGLEPCYLVDTPILQSDEAVAILGEFLASHQCSVGVHLHPWVTPPFDEEVSSPNSYAGNLPPAIERQKLIHVRDLIVQRLHYRPLVYRAGRYGIGPNTLQILEEEGFLCDTSVRSLFDYRADGGPDFRQASLHPSRVGPNNWLIELPLTTVFLGGLGRFGRKLHPWARRMPMAGGVLSRVGLLQRIPLTPEGVPVGKACEAIDVALDQGIQLLNFSFHSPSLAPGHTPYVRDAADLAAFYRWWDIVFAHAAKRGVTPVSLEEILVASGQIAAAQRLPA